MGKILARVTIFGIFLISALEASAQFPPFDSPSMRRQLPRGLPPAQFSEGLSDRPTISCSNLRNSVVQILCSGREGAAADWALNSAIWAYVHHVGESGKAAFEAEQGEWRNSIVHRCSLPSASPNFINKREANCVFGIFQERARQIRSRLPPEALAEANLTPEQRASIQQRLIDDGILSGTADGEFGPTTRGAIKRYQISQGSEPTGFLSQLSRSSPSDARQGNRQPAYPQLPTQPAEPDVFGQNREHPKLIELQRAESDLKSRPTETKARQEAAGSEKGKMQVRDLFEDPQFMTSVIVILLLIYCLPSIIAFLRRHPNRYLIAVINVFGGLTGFGWLLALLWSLHAFHRSSDEDSSHGGESGLNITVNDAAPVRLVSPDPTNQLLELKRLLDEGAIDQAEFSKLKARIIG